MSSLWENPCDDCKTATTRQHRPISQEAVGKTVGKLEEIRGIIVSLRQYFTKKVFQQTKRNSFSPNKKRKSDQKKSMEKGKAKTPTTRNERKCENCREKRNKNVARQTELKILHKCVCVCVCICVCVFVSGISMS